MPQTNFLQRRIETRELLMQFYYQLGVTNDYSENARKKFLNEHVLQKKTENDTTEKDTAEKDTKEIFEPDYKYFNNMIKAFNANREKIDAIISLASDNWKLERISKVDLAIIRLSVTEMMFLKNGDIPTKVSINEAVDIAKKYGTEKSPSFINGLLGRIVREEAANGAKTD